ncbi:XRE family transcriptional regulator [Romboutsia maritimum]|uniref:XRE family transcriptional regulator n=1 Tax=Romboutsia maritimum TaxID=2020948 RepID=A0A371IQU5_9FIRM|nr:helix-turn-helix transcriptional regulator [Romboutsia maritimum]RDY22846.1 XRE family transcriptional regulator [Romboutsia maritimum]
MFAERLKILREEKDLKQFELAKLLDLAPSTISMYEQGKRYADQNTLLKLADFFGVTTDFLLGKSNIKNINETDECMNEVLEVFKDYKGLSEDNKQIIIQLIKKLNNDK